MDYEINDKVERTMHRSHQMFDRAYSLYVIERRRNGCVENCAGYAVVACFEILNMRMMLKKIHPSKLKS